FVMKILADAQESSGPQRKKQIDSAFRESVESDHTRTTRIEKTERMRVTHVTVKPWDKRSIFISCAKRRANGKNSSCDGLNKQHRKGDRGGTVTKGVSRGCHIQKRG